MDVRLVGGMDTTRRPSGRLWRGSGGIPRPPEDPVAGCKWLRAKLISGGLLWLQFPADRKANEHCKGVAIFFQPAASTASALRKAKCPSETGTEASVASGAASAHSVLAMR